MNTTSITNAAALIVGVLLICGCSPKPDRAAEEGTLNSSAAIPSTNDTLRVNQPRAFQNAPGLTANGTNVQLAEAAGAEASSREGALADRVKTSLQTDPTLAPLVPGIRIAVVEGKIVLSGVVQTDAQKQSIFDKTRDIVGENKVVNRLQVQSTPDLTPAPDVQKKR